VMDESRPGEEKTSRVEGRGCVIGGQVVLGYPPETETRVRFRVSTKSGELQAARSQSTRISAPLIHNTPLLPVSDGTPAEADSVFLVCGYIT
jgi:hypothetical protein